MGREVLYGYIQVDVMELIAIKLRVRDLENPDADIRYELPELLEVRSEGVISSNGYDYVGPKNDLVVFLDATEFRAAVECILEVVKNVRALRNDLSRACVVAVRREGEFKVVYPEGYDLEFEVNAGWQR